VALYLVADLRACLQKQVCRFNSIHQYIQIALLGSMVTRASKRLRKQPIPSLLLEEILERVEDGHDDWGPDIPAIFVQGCSLDATDI
jgi:hypothetical protein